MRIILSRKGFDSSSGGCPNPVFPDGSLLALPIPDRCSPIRYRDIGFQSKNLGSLVHQLTGGKVKSGDGAHLDPDIEGSRFPRSAGWRPLFGQMGAAQGHLSQEGVGKGDLFLFFGLFRPVEKLRNRWRFVPGSPARHRIWGWFQVGSIARIGELPADMAQWADYHPHLRYPDRKNNHLYVAAESLQLGGREENIPGAGCFSSATPALCLSDPESRLPSRWKLPGWFYPGQGRKPLSYHGNPARWNSAGDCCRLTSVSRGQEFVLNAAAYPPAKAWASELIVRAREG